MVRHHTIGQRLANWGKLRLLDLLIALNTQRYDDASKLYATLYGRGNARATCEAKEKQRQHKIRLQQLGMDQWEVSRWR